MQDKSDIIEAILDTYSYFVYRRNHNGFLAMDISYDEYHIIMSYKSVGGNLTRSSSGPNHYSIKLYGMDLKIVIEPERTHVRKIFEQFYVDNKATWIEELINKMEKKYV